MFGKIIAIDNDLITVSNTTHVAESSVLNYHVILTENNRRVIGEIIGIDEESIKINLLGEIINDQFKKGVSKKPSTNCQIRLIYKSEVEFILGKQDISSKDTLLLGKSSIYDGYNISVSLNDFFSSHFAILGNSGAGKSCGVASIIQNIFYYNDTASPVNAHLVLFDAYGEYNKALNKINQLPNLGYKYYTTNTTFSDAEIIKFPAYFLEVDDLALLLNCTSSTHLPLLEKTLRYVYIFKSEDEAISEYKNDIIARCLLDILSSGKSATQMRDQIIAVLSKYNTETLNLDTLVYQPGYNRKLSQCLNIDNQGKMNAIGFVIELLQEYADQDINEIKYEKDVVYNLDDLYYALEFALLSEGVYTDETTYEAYNQIKVRLNAIINSPTKQFFEVDKLIGKSDYIKEFFTTVDRRPAQIVNININYIDDRMAKILTKIYAKLFFNYTTNLLNRGSFPIHIILEEAHRYVQNDNDINIIGYNIFDRIAKEGRKYGTILGFITQRPSELSETALSQCANVIVFRMFHPADLSIISNISANVSAQDIEKIKTFPSGMALTFGTAFKIPLMTKFNLPNPLPVSNNIDVEKTWF